LIGHFPNSLRNRIRPNILWTKLTDHVKSCNSISKGHIKEYAVSYLKFQGPSPPISIAHLATLSHFHFLLDDPNLVDGCLDQVECNGKGLVDVLPAERGPAVPSIQYFIRGHRYIGVVNIVVGEFKKRQLLIASPLEVESASLQHIFQCLDASFRLSINCRIECCTKTE